MENFKNSCQSLSPVSTLVSAKRTARRAQTLPCVKHAGSAIHRLIELLCMPSKIGLDFISRRHLHWPTSDDFLWPVKRPNLELLDKSHIFSSVYSRHTPPIQLAEYVIPAPYRWGEATPWTATQPIGLIVAVREFQNAPTIGGIHHNTAHLDKLFRGMNWSADATVVMTDHMSWFGFPHLHPTAFNVLAQLAVFMSKLVTSKAGIISFNSHGFQLPCPPGKTDEADGMDEYIALMNGESLMDDVLKKAIVDCAPRDSALLVLLDTCHSGTLLDLPYQVNIDRLETHGAPSGKRPEDGRGLVLSIAASDDHEETFGSDEYGGTFTLFITHILYVWSQNSNWDGLTIAQLVRDVQILLDNFASTKQHVTVYSSHPPESVDVNLVLRGLRLMR